jgi:hypothetical protein
MGEPHVVNERWPGDARGEPQCKRTPEAGQSPGIIVITAQC